MNNKEKYEKIKQEIKNNSISKEVEIIAVSKTFSKEKILPLIDYGHIDFGENKVQEAFQNGQVLKISLKI